MTRLVLVASVFALHALAIAASHGPRHVVVSHQDNNATNARSGASTAGVGVAVTFSANFFTNLFDTLAEPIISQFVTSYQFPSFHQGLPLGGKLTVNPPQISQFQIEVGALTPQYPATFAWSLDQINIAGGTSFNARWRMCIIWCFTWLSCGASIGIHAEDISISGVMDFQQSGDQVSVSSPSEANWAGKIKVHAGNAGCGWFMDFILRLFFGNLNSVVENVIETAITRANVGQEMANTVNNIFDKTLNSGFKDLHICGYSFYPGNDYMSVFTHETSDLSSPCLNQILPTSLAGKAPTMDIAVLARIAIVPSWVATPAPWAIISCSTKQNCMELPIGLNSELSVTQCSVCTGIDGDLGIYMIGEVDVAVINPWLNQRQLEANRDRLLGLPPRLERRSRNVGARRPRGGPHVEGKLPQQHKCHQRAASIDEEEDVLLNSAGALLLLVVSATIVVITKVVRRWTARTSASYKVLVDSEELSCKSEAS